MQQQANALSRGSTASVAIGLNTDPTFLKVSAINQRLKLLQPSTDLIFHICQSTETAQKLRHNQIDLGFFYGDNQEPDIEHIVVSHVRTCVVIPTQLAPSGQKLDWLEVADLPWIWVDNNFPFYRALQQSLDDYSTVPNKAVTAVDEQIVRELVVAGQGVAIMREDEARPLVEHGQATIWGRGWGDIPLCLGWMSRNRDVSRIETTRDVINYIWRKPEIGTDDSLTDKCWV
jgi:DNA-binding transcriptional LysR family regulator